MKYFNCLYYGSSLSDSWIVIDMLKGIFVRATYKSFIGTRNLFFFGEKLKSGYSHHWQFKKIKLEHETEQGTNEWTNE